MTDQIYRRLTTDTLAWFTTVSHKGRPAPRLVWFMWIGESCLVFSQPDAAKLTHLATNSRVTLNFNSNAQGGDAVVLAGRAELATDVRQASDVPGLLAKYADLLQTIGMTAASFTGTYSVPIRVTFDHAWTIP